jgi:uncharacterized surface protein with fasciclin (FAS1) repeats
VNARIALLLATLVGAGLLVSAAPAAQSAPTASKKTVVAVAAGDKRFSTLVSLVKQAGLVKTLNGKGPFTVFAPTNAAFAALKRNAPETFDAVASDKELLTAVLTYHVVGKRIPSTAAVAVAKKNGSVKTVQGERIKLSLKGGKLFLNGSSRVIIPDVKASNGVIHAINAVIVPPSVS